MALYSFHSFIAALGSFQAVREPFKGKQDYSVITISTSHDSQQSLSDTEPSDGDKPQTKLLLYKQLEKQQMPLFKTHPDQKCLCSRTYWSVPISIV